MATKIEISGGTIVKIILWILFFYGLYYFKSLVFLLFLSVIIASVVDRLVVFLKRFKIPRIITVISLYSIMTLASFPLSDTYLC